MNDAEKDLQKETGSDSAHVDRCIAVTGMGRTFDLHFRMPRAIDDSLRAEDWDFCETQINAVATDMFVSFLMNGLPIERALQLMQKRVVDALYRRFVNRQLEDGNKKWLVPDSMQDVYTDDDFVAEGRA